jgi:hypothetical protein
MTQKGDLAGTLEVANILEDFPVAVRPECWHRGRVRGDVKSTVDRPAEIPVCERLFNEHGEIGNNQRHARLDLVEGVTMTEKPFFEQTFSVI